jgi:hypothetical protein
MDTSSSARNDMVIEWSFAAATMKQSLVSVAAFLGRPWRQGLYCETFAHELSINVTCQDLPEAPCRRVPCLRCPCFRTPP